MRLSTLRLIKTLLFLPAVVAFSSVTAFAQVPESKLTAADGATGDQFGYMVAVDGGTAVVGALRNDAGASDTGAAYVWVRSGATATQQQKLTASDAAADDQFGFSVAIDGDTAVVGALRDDDFGTDSGAAYVFVRSAGVWSQQQKLTAADGAAGDFFGWAVAIDGDTLIVGARGDDDLGSTSGSAYVFVRTAGIWTQQQKITAADGAAGDQLGFYVSIEGETALLAAPTDDDNGADSGSTYVFVRSGTVWSQQQKLTAADGASGDEFGFSVSVSGDTAVVGARLDDDLGSDSGSAYVFVRSGVTWSQQQKLTAADGAADDWFGTSVDIDGNAVLVGARLDDDNGTASGSAYLYLRSGTTWTETHKLLASDGDVEDRYGRTVALDGDTAVVGARYDNDNGSNSGSAYLYDLSTLLAAPFAGTGDDLIMESSVNGGGALDDPSKHAAAGDELLVGFLSPGGTLDFTEPLLLGQLFDADASPTAVFPGIAVDPFIVPGPVLLFDGNIPGSPVGDLLLPPGGFTFLAFIPPALSGWSFLFQAYAFSGLAGNGVFASTTGHAVAVH